MNNNQYTIYINNCLSEEVTVDNDAICSTLMLLGFKGVFYQMQLKNLGPF